MIVRHTEPNQTRILSQDDPKLRKVCTSATFKEAQMIGKQLRREMRAYQKLHPDWQVVGLAAPQIGVNRRLFMALKDLFINPKIIEVAEGKSKSVEGCLSCKGLYEVERDNIVRLSYIDGAGKFHPNDLFAGSYASVILHELDHLDGKLITDTGKPYKRPK